MKATWEKVKGFMGKYGYIALILVAMIVLAIVISVGTAMATAGNVDDPLDDVGGVVNTFCDPVSNFTLAKDYCPDNVVYNQSLKKWTPHKNVDLVVEDASSVFAVLDGVVTNIQKDYMKGTIVTVDHGNGLVTKYSSLAEDVNVTLNGKVTRGQVIGKATKTPEEELMGPRLNFAVFEDGKAVDPNNYLDLKNK